MAPRRWRLRDQVAAENQRTLQLHLLANGVIGLIRTVALRSSGQALPPGFERQLSELADALDLLAATNQPWPHAVRDQVRATALELQSYSEKEPNSTAAAILASVAGDVMRLISEPSDLVTPSMGSP